MTCSTRAAFGCSGGPAWRLSRPFPRGRLCSSLGRHSNTSTITAARRHTMQESLLLKLPGITGTARQSGHVGEIELTEFDYQVSVLGSTGPGQLTIEKRWDAASSALFQA